MRADQEPPRRSWTRTARSARSNRGTRSKRSPRSSHPHTGRSPSCSSAPACDPRSCTGSTGRTSTARTTSSTSSVSTRRAGPEAVQEVRPAAAPGSAPGEGAGGDRRHAGRGSTRPCCSPRRTANGSATPRSGCATGHRRYGRPESSIGASTPPGTPSPRGASAPASSSSTSRRIMGTSVAQIDATYGHLVPDSEEYLRGLLDTFDAERLGTEQAQ